MELMMKEIGREYEKFCEDIGRTERELMKRKEEFEKKVSEESPIKEKVKEIIVNENDIRLKIGGKILYVSKERIGKYFVSKRV